jgi:hypothetical protein
MTMYYTIPQMAEMDAKIKELEDTIKRIKTVVEELEATPLPPTLQGNAYVMGLKTAGRKVTLTMTLTPMTEDG